MKPTVKRLSTLALAVTMTVGLMAGCGNAETKENETPKANDTANNATGNANKVVVDFWSIWDTANGNGKLLADAAAKFNSENPGIEVVVSNQGGYDGVAEKLEAALVAKKPPVIAQIEESFIARYFPVAADLSKYESKATIDNYIKGLTVSSYVDGVFKAAPLNRSTPILYLNADLLEKAGLPAEGPKTWDELYEFAKKIAKPDKGIYGFSGHWDSDAWFWESALYSYGGEVVNEDGSKVAFDNDKGYKIVQMWQKMSNEKTMLNPYSSQGNVSDIVKQNFIDGKVGMMLDSVGAMGPLLKDQAAFKVNVAYQPAGEKNAMVTGGANMIILDSSTEDQKIAAGKFMDYLASDEFVVNFYITSGYFATTQSSLETQEVKDLFAEHPQFKVAIDQLQFAHKRPWQKNWRAMYTSIVDDLQGAMVDTKSDAKAIIHTAAVKAQKIMDDNK